MFFATTKSLQEYEKRGSDSPWERMVVVQDRLVASVRGRTEQLRRKVGGQLGEALARTSRSKIAAGVRGDNWSEGRLRCRWTNDGRPI